MGLKGIKSRITRRGYFGSRTLIKHTIVIIIIIIKVLDTIIVIPNLFLPSSPSYSCTYIRVIHGRQRTDT